MSTVMMGTDVAKSMKEDLIRQTEELKSQGVEPTLCILRVGARPDDLSYERGAKKRMELVGIRCQVVELPEDTQLGQDGDRIVNAADGTIVCY